MNKEQNPCVHPLVLCVSVFLVSKLSAQIPSQWKAHDLNRPRPRIVQPGCPGITCRSAFGRSDFI